MELHPATRIKAYFLKEVVFEQAQKESEMFTGEHGEKRYAWPTAKPEQTLRAQQYPGFAIGSKKLTLAKV